MSSISLRTIREEHASLAAVLHSLRLMLDQGPGDDPAAFFDVMRAMLFYIDEFPERQHHPKESQWLFPRVAERSPQAAEAIAQLEREHAGGEAAVRELQHLLLGWELMGDARREVFAQALQRYIRFYLDHMRLGCCQRPRKTCCRVTGWPSTRPLPATPTRWPRASRATRPMTGSSPASSCGRPVRSGSAHPPERLRRLVLTAAGDRWLAQRQLQPVRPHGAVPARCRLRR